MHGAGLLRRSAGKGALLGKSEFPPQNLGKVKEGEGERKKSPKLSSDLDVYAVT